MDARVEEDTQRYREALETAGGVFGGIEPIQRFYEAFQRPLDAAHAAAVVGLETEAFLQKIHQDTSLQNLGLLLLENETMKRDAWTSKFSEIVLALEEPSTQFRLVDPADGTHSWGICSYSRPKPAHAAIAEKLLASHQTPQLQSEEMATLPNRSQRMIKAFKI